MFWTFFLKIGTKTNSAVLRLTNILNNADAREAIYKEICVVLK